RIFRHKIGSIQRHFFAPDDDKNCRKSVRFAQCLFEEFLDKKYHYLWQIWLANQIYCGSQNSKKAVEIFPETSKIRGLPQNKTAGVHRGCRQSFVVLS